MSKKKLYLLVLVLTLLIAVSATLVACGTGKTNDLTLSITYVVDGDIVRTAELSGFDAIFGYFTPTKTGHDFAGWYVNATLTEKLTNSSQLVDGLTLYAKFVKKSYTVEFIGEDGAIINSQNVLYGESATPPTPPTVAGKEFVGWDNDFSSVTANLVVNALYQEVSKYTVSFTSNGVVVYTSDYIPGESTSMLANTATEKVDEPAGFAFVKWVDSAGNEIGNTFPTSGGALSYKAVYELREIVDLTLDSSLTSNTFAYSPEKTVTLTANLSTYKDISYSYAWYKGGVLLETETGNTLTLNNIVVGTYDYKVVVTATCDDLAPVSDEKSYSFTVENANITGITATPTSVTYDGQGHNVTVMAEPGDVVEYKLADGQWTDSLNLVSAGEYDVYYRVSRPNYNTFESTAPVKVTISKRLITGAILPTILTYGDPMPSTYTVEYTGFVEGEDESVFTGDVLFVPGIYNTLATGTFGVKANINSVSADNYLLSISDGTITVGKKDLEVTADSLTVTYGDELPSITLSYKGFIDGDTATALDVAPTATCSYEMGTTGVGTFDITVSGGESANYNFIYKSGTLTVSQRKATITADDKHITYGESLDSISLTGKSEGVLASDNLVITISAEGYTSTSKAGSIFSLVPYAENNNYDFTFANGTLTVDKKNVTVIAGNTSVVYGEKVDLSGVGFTDDGIVNNDLVDVHFDTDYTVGAGAGRNFDIVPSAEHENYNFTFISGTLTVEKRSSTIVVDNKDVIYGDDLPTLTAVVSGVYGTDSLDYHLTANYTSGTTGVGTVDITVTLGTNNNYEVVTTNGTLTVEKRNAIITADDQSITYGDTLDTSAYSFKAENVLASDTLTVTYTVNGYTTATAVGTEGITITPYAENSNYNFTFVDGTLSVTKKAVTIIANNGTVTYGEEADVSGVGFVDNGIINGDTVTVTYTTDYTVGASAGRTFNIMPNATHNNYSFTFVNGALSVEKRNATITTENKTVLYGDELPELTTVVNGVYGSDVLDYSLATNYIAGTTGVGTADITVNLGNNPNYEVSATNGTLTVEKRNATITADNQTITYGDTLDTSAYTFKAENVLASDTLAVTYTVNGYATATAVGTTGITITPYTENDNYNFTFVDGTLSVTKKAVTITANNGTVTYGEEADVSGVGFVDNGIINGDVVEVTYSTDYTLGANAGTTHNIVPTATHNNYDFTFVNGVLTVTKRNATITADNQTITYGDTLDTSAYTFKTENVLAGDTLTVTYTVNGYTTATAVGTTGITITPSAENSNYNFTFVDGTLSVTKKAVSITANNGTVTYGEEADVSGVGFVDNGIINGDVVTVTYSTDYTVGANAGTTHNIVPHATHNNYEFSFTNGTLTVEKRSATVVADNKSVTYGNELPTLTAVVTGTYGADTLNYTLSAEYVQGTTGVGTKDIVVTLGNNPNYEVSATNGTLTVEKRNATVTANPASVTYGDTVPALTADVTGTYGSDTLNYSLKADYTPGTTGVGTVDIVATLGNNPNYNVTTVSGTLTVNARALSYTLNSETASIWSNSVWTNSSLVPGQVASGTLTLTATELGTYTYPNGFEWTIAFDIKANGVSVLGNYAVSFNVKVDVVTHDFDVVAEDKYVTYNGKGQSVEVGAVTLNSAASSQNYTVEYKVGDGEYSTSIPTFVNAGDYAVNYRVTPEDSIYYPDPVTGTITLHISAKEITATVSNATKTYGDDNPVFIGTLVGVEEGDTVEINYYLANNATAKNVGEYTITANFKNVENNYTLKVANGTLTVEKRSATVVADNKSVTYGNTSPALTATTSNVLDGDTLEYSLKANYTPSTTGVGTVEIVVALGNNPNYEVSATNGTLTVERRNATITADDQSITYGDTLSTAGYAFKAENVLASDTLAVTYTVNGYTTATAVGTTGITITPYTENDNYNFTFVDGALSVTKKAVSITANNNTVVYGEEADVSGVGFTDNGIINGDVVEVTYSTDYTLGANAGTTHNIVPTATHNNYEFTFVNGVLTVTKRNVTITADNQTITYGDTLSTAGYTFTDNGIVSGDVISVSYSVSGYDTGAVTGNTFDITPSAENGNYNFTFVEGTLTVTKKTATITAGNATVVYGEEVDLSTITFTSEGIINGDTVTVTFSAPDYVTGASAGETFNIVPDTTHANYNFIFVNGTLTVTKKELTATVNNASKVYGQDNPTFSGTVSGLVGADTVEMNYYLTNSTAKNVGTYTITAAFKNTENNYTLKVVDGTLTITAKEVTITANDTAITYGDTPNFNNLGHTADGLVGTDNVEVVFTTDYVTASGAGTYNVIPEAYGTYVNYTFKYANGTLTVNPKDATITVKNASIEYGNNLDTVSFSTTFSGILADDSILVSYEVPSYTETSTAGTTHAIKARATHKNYNFTFVDGTLSVTKKELTVTVNNASKVYGDSNPVFSGTVSGLVGTDTVEMNYYLTNSTAKNVGTYAITAAFKNTENNYTLKVVDGTLTITAKSVTIKAGNTSVTYGSAANLNSIDYTIDGLVAGDSIEAVLSSAYTAGNSVGTYAIVPKENGAYPNYVIGYENGTLTVNPKTVTVNITEATVEYGKAISAVKFAYTVDGKLASDTITVTCTSATYTAGSPVGGTYAITPVASNSNYTYTYTGVSTVTVVPYESAIVWETTSLTYNGAVQTPKAYYLDNTGAKVYATVTVDGDAEFKNAGTYNLVATTADTNYTLTNTTTTATIAKANYDATAVAHPGFSGLTYDPNRKLSNLDLNTDGRSGYTWTNGNTTPTVPVKTYSATYNGDPANYNTITISVPVTLTKATVSIEGTLTQEMNYNATSSYTFDMSQIVVKYNGTPITVQFGATPKTESVASTYQYTLTVSDDNYQGSATATLKVKSVDVGGTLYTIEDALNTASSGTAIVKANTVFSTTNYYKNLANSASYYTVKDGVTLLVPYDSNYSTSQTDYTTGGIGSAYVTLTVVSGITLNVNGSAIVNVNGRRGNYNTNAMGGTNGNYGCLDLKKGSTINFNGTSKLYSLGYTIGDGIINMNSGTTAYDVMAMKDFHGGTITSGLYSETFPISQYSIANIEAEINVYTGASLIAFCYVTASGYSDVSREITLLGNGGLFSLTGDNSADHLCKKIDTSTGKTHITIYGNAQSGSLSISVSIMTLSTKDNEMPLPGNMHITIASGNTSLANRFKLLPGASITVNSGATLTIASGGKLVQYQADVVGKEYLQCETNSSYGENIGANQTRLGKAGGYTNTSASALIVNGTISVASGGSLGARVLSNENGGKITISGNASASFEDRYKKGGFLNLQYVGTTYTVSSTAVHADNSALSLSTGTYTYNGSTWSKTA